MIHNSPKTLSILLIEDNPADRRLAEIALDEAAMEGQLICDLRTAGTLAEGLACLQEATCGVILIDLDLPDAKGLDGVRRLHAAYPDIPIVVLTGLSDQSLTMGVLEAGAGDYLEKSDMRPKALLRTLRYAIERKAMECRLVELAETDSLTGLLNRRAFLANVEVARLQAAEGLSERISTTFSGIKQAMRFWSQLPMPSRQSCPRMTVPPELVAMNSPCFCVMLQQKKPRFAEPMRFLQHSKQSACSMTAGSAYISALVSR